MSVERRAERSGLYDRRSKSTAGGVFCKHSSAARPVALQGERELKNCAKTTADARRKPFVGAIMGETPHFLKIFLSEGKYAMDLIASNLLAYKSRQRCRSCSERQKLSKSSSPTSPNADGRRTNFRRKTPCWIRASALLIMLTVTCCHASPTTRSSRRRPAIAVADTDDSIAMGLSNSTRRMRNARKMSKRGSSDFDTHNDVQKLYNNFNGLFLEVNKKGKVSGTPDKNSPYTNVRIWSVRTGHVAIFFEKSKKYLAMKAKKKALYTTDEYSEECCLFKELYALYNRHFMYEWANTPKPKRSRGKKKAKKTRRRYVALLKNKKVRRSYKANRSTMFTKLSTKRGGKEAKK